MESLRSIASIAVGYVGFAVGGPLGFAVATVAFNVLVPPKQPDQDTNSGKGQGQKNTAIGTAIFEVYGRWEREGGELIRCARDQYGQRSGILVVTKEEKVGGSRGSGGGSRKQKVKRDYQFAQASFGLCGGFTKIIRMTEINAKDGEKVLLDRVPDYNPGFRGAWASGVTYFEGQTVTYDRTRWRALQDHVATNNNRPRKDSDFWVKIQAVSSLNFTPIYGAVSGQEIGLISDTLRLYFGSEEQPVDSAENGWYDDGVSADRGITKVVFNKYGPLESGTVFRYLLENEKGERREIIRDRLGRAGVPASRMDFRSIPPTLADYGWSVEGREAARVLAENVAAFSFHDLLFLSTKRGMCFTDVSRAAPTTFVIPDAKMGAYSNENGGGTLPSSITGTVQGGESKPRELNVSFFNLNKNFKNDSAFALWTAANGEPTTVSFRVITDVQTAMDWAEVAMRELQAATGTVEIVLMPEFCEAAPGCALDVSAPTEANPLARAKYRIVQQAISPDGILANVCAPFDESTFAPVPLQAITVEPPPTVRQIAVPQVLLLDTVNIVDDTVNEPYGLMVGYCDPDENWGGCIVSCGNKAFPDVEIPSRGEIGLTQTALNYTPMETAYFDYSKTLRVKMEFGSLASASEADVLEGANILYVGGTFLAFVTAVPLGGGVYDLTGLWLGLFGSDFVVEVPVGARVVKISDNEGNQEDFLVGVEWSRRWLNSPVTYRTYAAQKTDEASDELQMALTGENLKPLSVSPWITKGADVPAPLDGSAWEYGYFLKFFARSRYPETGEDFTLSGIPVRHADPLSFTVTLRANDGTVLDERTVSSVDSEVTVHYTRAELLQIYGSVPATLRGEIFQNGQFGEGRVRSFEV